MKITRIFSAVLLGSWGLLAGEVSALTTSWTNAAGGLWSAASNWSQGSPGSLDSAVIDLSGTYTVTMNAPNEFITVLILGGATGTQTLQVDEVLNVGDQGFTTVARIRSHGVLNLANAMNITASGAGYALVNSGQVTCNGGGGDLLIPDGDLLNDTTGVITLNGSSQVLSIWGVVNRGTLDCYGTGAVFSNTGITNNAGALIDVHGANIFNDIVNAGLVNLRTGSSLHLASLSGYDDSDLLVSSGGELRLRGNCFVTGEDAMFGVSEIQNGGLVDMVADTSLANDNATIAIGYTSGAFSNLEIQTGNLLLTDTVNSTGFTTVSATCTLAIAGDEATFSGFSGSGGVAGTGIVHFRAGVSDLAGDFAGFTGGIHLTGSALAPTYVNLHPSEPYPTISALRLGTNYTTFEAPIGGAVTTNQIIQLGGTIIGSVSLNSFYDWLAGTYTTVTAPSVHIPAGVLLTMTGNAAKTLDSLDLLIDGAAVFEDSGAFTLVDSAVVSVRSAATCDFGYAFTLNGVGSFYNSGDTDFDPQGDTIFMNVPVYNSTVDRTPGTIDLLGRTVVWGAGGRNEGGINIFADAELILAESYENDGTIVVADGGELTVEDSLINEGTTDMEGGSGMGGDGTTYNEGDLNSQGSALMSITNVRIQPTLANAGAGHVNVISDTLTLLNGGVNKGVITIAAGSVLKIFGVFLNDTTGVIQGPGVLDVTMAIFTNNGVISPGASPGLLTIRGNVEFGATSQLNMEINGALAVLYDRVQVIGQATLGGTINLLRAPSYVPTMTDTQQLVSYNGHAGLGSNVTGTAIGDGRFFEIAEGGTALVSYVCSGVSDISPSVLSWTDSIVQTETNFDTVEIELCNDGHCPLQYTLELALITPGSWLSLASGDESGLLTRTNCGSARLYANMTGRPEGLYQAELGIMSNDPDEGLVTIPLSWTVVHGPDYWDVGGGDIDFPTIGDAVSYLNSTTILHPQIFDVYPGTYPGVLTLSAVAGASAINTILFRAQNPANHPVLASSGGGAGNGGAVLRLLGVDHATFDGVDVRRTGGGGMLRIAVLDTANADSNEFRNMTIGGSDSSTSTMIGVLIAQGPAGLTNDHFHLDNVYVHGFYTGVSFTRNVTTAGSGVGNEVEHCLIENCVRGVYARAEVGLLIHDNTFHPGYSGATVTVSAVFLDQTNPGDLFDIYNNVISDFRTNASCWGIASSTFQPLSRLRIYNNLFYGWTGVLFDCRAISLSSAGPTEVYYNTIRMGENSSNALNVHHGIDIASSSDSTKLYNNILASDAVTDSTYLVYRSSGRLRSDRNCFNGTGSRTVVGYDNGASYPTLTAWQTGTSQDANSIQDIPGFVSTTDLHIDGYWTTCDQRASSVEWLDTDMDGEPRGGPFSDIGADEFVGITDKLDSLVIRKQVGTNNVQLNWEAIAGAQSWKVYRGDVQNFVPSEGTGGTWIGTTAGGVRSFVDSTPLSPGAPIKRFYKVRPSTVP